MNDIERNKQRVQQLLDAIKQGDIDAFDDLVADDYVQHNPQVASGRQEMKGFFSSVGPLDLEVHRIIAEGDLVVVHSHLRTWDMAVIDIFRLDDDGRIIEHWDVLQEVPETTASGNDLFRQLS